MGVEGKPASTVDSRRGLAGVVLLAALLTVGYHATRSAPSLLRDPYSVYGVVWSPQDGPVSEGVVVELTNLATAQNLSGSTDQEGKYVFDLSTLPAGYMDGDRILVKAHASWGHGSAEGLVDLSQPGSRIDVHMGLAVRERSFLLAAGLIVAFFFAGRLSGRC